MSLREVLKQKKLAKEQAEINNIEENENNETIYPSFTSDEINSIEELKTQEAEVDSIANSGEVIDQLQDRIDANQKLIEAEAEPTEAQVVQAINEAKHFAYISAELDNFITESIDFEFDGQRYVLATESFTFNAKSRKEQLKDVNLVLEGMAKSLLDNIKNIGKQILEIIKNIISKIKELFSKRVRVVNFATKYKAEISKMYKDVKGVKELSEKIPETERKAIYNKLDKSQRDLAETLFKISVYAKIMESKGELSENEIKDCGISKEEFLKFLQKAPSLLPLLVKDIMETKKSFDKFINNLNMLEKIPAVIYSKMLKRMDIYEHIEYDTIINDNHQDLLGTTAESICAYYSKSFDSILKAYHEIKPGIFDEFEKASATLLGAGFELVSKVTDNKNINLINSSYHAIKELVTMSKIMTDAIYTEIEVCVQFYQKYVKEQNANNKE